MQAPLIVTLGMESAAKSRLTGWRRRFFPPERNFLDAHLTLYHHLPGAEEDRVRSQLCEVVAARSNFRLEFTGLRAQGGFVAVEVLAPELVGLKKELDGLFKELLVPQDRQGLKPHVTVMNKATAAQGAQCLAELQLEFVPFTAMAEGLELYHYAGGPWVPLERLTFGGR